MDTSGILDRVEQIVSETADAALYAVQKDRELGTQCCVFPWPVDVREFAQLIGQPFAAKVMEECTKRDSRLYCEDSDNGLILWWTESFRQGTGRATH